MVSKVITGALCSMEGHLIAVETDVSKGMPCFDLVGSLSCEVREAKERVRIALKNAGISLPAMRITVNLSPADVRKDGNAYDLPIAVSVAAALGTFKWKEERIFVAGELGLNGEVKHIRGVLPLIMEAKKQGIRKCIVPRVNAAEGAVIEGMEVLGADNLLQVLAYLKSSVENRAKILRAEVYDDTVFGKEKENVKVDFADIGGQENTKRAAEIAAAGFHNLFMIGPPGSGKTMMAKAIAGILPPMSMEEALEVSAVYSIAGLLPKGSPILSERPFVSPDNCVTPQALAGGGRIPKPGAVSLAHRGILFLDEMAQFRRGVLDILRQPMEEKKICIIRNGGTFFYPADFMLVAASNPCPCGYYPDLDKCRCSEHEIRRYLSPISGPIMDRVDLCVETVRADVAGLQHGKQESSRQIRDRVCAARKMQEIRYLGTKYRFNADVAAGDMEKYCFLEAAEKQFMNKAYTSMKLSPRAYYKILKTARTIADLAGEERIRKSHLGEAVYYKVNEKKY